MEAIRVGDAGHVERDESRAGGVERIRQIIETGGESQRQQGLVPQPCGLRQTDACDRLTIERAAVGDQKCGLVDDATVDVHAAVVRDIGPVQHAPDPVRIAKNRRILHVA